MTTKKSKPHWTDWNVPMLPNGSVPWKNPGETIYRRYNGKWQHVPIEHVPNKPFKAGLKFKRLRHGNSSSQAVFENSETGAEYIMRSRDFEEVLNKGVLIQGLILGEWRFRKNGGYFSIVPIELHTDLDN